VISTVFGKISEGDFTGAFEAISGTATPAVQGLADAFSNLEMQANLVSVAVATEAQATLATVPITDLATAATNKRSEAQRILNQLMREGKRVTEEMATPEEALLARQQKLTTLLMAQAISAETYGRADARHLRRDSLGDRGGSSGSGSRGGPDFRHP
jgi:hypothetical protein